MKKNHGMESIKILFMSVENQRRGKKFNSQLTPQSRVLPEKLTGPQLVENSLHFNEPDVS
jgi:hypothetical protein